MEFNGLMNSSMETALFILKYALKVWLLGQNFKNGDYRRYVWCLWVLEKCLKKFHKMFILNYISSQGWVPWYNEYNTLTKTKNS